jgi:hypothetical protein
MLQKFLKHKRIAFLIVSSLQSSKENEVAKNKFNHGDAHVLLNFDIIEGMSLEEVRTVIFLEPPLRVSTYQQVIARARRLTSHKNIIKKADRHVQVYILISTCAAPSRIQTELQTLLDYYSAYIPLTRALARESEPGKAAVHKLAAESMGEEKLKSWIGDENDLHKYLQWAPAMQYPLMVVNLLVTPRSSVRKVAKWFKNASGTEDAERAALSLSSSISFNIDTAGTPDTVAWRNLEVGGNALTELNMVLNTRNIQVDKVYESMPASPSCAEKCTVWPEKSASQTVLSCMERKLPLEETSTESPDTTQKKR